MVYSWPQTPANKQLKQDVVPLSLKLTRNALEAFATRFETSSLFWECVLRPSPWAKCGGACYVHGDVQQNVRSTGVIFRQCQQ